jgi:hypothetical protein
MAEAIDRTAPHTGIKRNDLWTTGWDTPETVEQAEFFQAYIAEHYSDANSLSAAAREVAAREDMATNHETIIAGVLTLEFLEKKENKVIKALLYKGKLAFSSVNYLRRQEEKYGLEPLDVVRASIKFAKNHNLDQPIIDETAEEDINPFLLAKVIPDHVLKIGSKIMQDRTLKKIRAQKGKWLKMTDSAIFRIIVVAREAGLPVSSVLKEVKVPREGKLDKKGLKDFIDALRKKRLALIQEEFPAEITNAIKLIKKQISTVALPFQDIDPVIDQDAKKLLERWKLAEVDLTPYRHIGRPIHSFEQVMEEIKTRFELRQNGDEQEPLLREIAGQIGEDIMQTHNYLSVGKMLKTYPLLKYLFQHSIVNYFQLRELSYKYSKSNFHPINFILFCLQQRDGEKKTIGDLLAAKDGITLKEFKTGLKKYLPSAPPPRRANGGQPALAKSLSELPTVFKNKLHLLQQEKHLDATRELAATLKHIRGLIEFNLQENEA